MTTEILSAYLSANYYSKCPKESLFLRSWPYLVYPLQYSNIIFIPLAILAGYCILFKTPKSMQPMKWVYFNLHFWMSIQSVYLTLLFTPYVWLPSVSVSSLGLLSKLGVSDVCQGYLGMTFWIMSMAATVSLFENRHQQIQNNRLREKRKWIRFPVLGFNYLYSIFYPYPVFMEIPDQPTARLAFLKAIPCPYEEFFTLPFYTFTIEPRTRNYLFFSLMTAMGLTMIQLIFYTATCFHYLVLIKSSVISKVVRNRQKRFFIGALIQISIPYALMCPAIFYFGVSFLTGCYSQKINNLVVLILNMNGIVSTSILICHRPYRKFVRKLFC